MNKRKAEIYKKMYKDLDSLPQPSGYEAFEKKIYNIGKNSLDCCQPTVTGWIDRNDPYPIPVVETRSANMRATIDMTGDASKDYIAGRLAGLYWTKEKAIYAAFESPHPKDAKEAKKWLAEGNCYIRTYGDDEDSEDRGCYDFEWGPKLDYTKRTEQLATLNKAMIDAKDTVSVLTDETARLKALKDFESFTVN